MSPPAELLGSVASGLGQAVARADRAAGAGSINDAWRLELEDGSPVLVKSRAGAPAVEFEAEAAGLAWLREAGAARVPAVLGVGSDPAWLALEWVEPGTLSAAGAEELGRNLAALHVAGAEAHGALPPSSPDRVLRIGSVELPGAEAPRWNDVYAEHRLRPLLAMARGRGTIAAADAQAVESLCERLDELAGPPERPARLHGDLWSGNVHAAADGSPWLIDPAAHGGNREIDLAMLRLFGHPGERLFAAYEEVNPLAEGHRERVELWQVLPLLVHAVLFGASYGASAGAAARRYL